MYENKKWSSGLLRIKVSDEHAACIFRADFLTQ
jgi:hypothetical protein